MQLIVAYTLMVVVLVGGLWIESGDAPGVQVLLFLVPAAMLLGQYIYAKRYERRLVHL
jgi:hypothetical protein